MAYATAAIPQPNQPPRKNWNKDPMNAEEFRKSDYVRKAVARMGGQAFDQVQQFIFTDEPVDPPGERVQATVQGADVRPSTPPAARAVKPKK